MEMCYDGALVMPSNYAVMSEDEMTYVEGGVKSRSINWISIPIDVVCSYVGLNASAIIGCAGNAIAKFAAKHIAKVAASETLKKLLGSGAVGFLQGVVLKASKNNMVLSMLNRMTSFGGIIGIMCDLNDGVINNKFNSPI